MERLYIVEIQGAGLRQEFVGIKRNLDGPGIAGQTVSSGNSSVKKTDIVYVGVTIRHASRCN